MNHDNFSILPGQFVINDILITHGLDCAKLARQEYAIAEWREPHSVYYVQVDVQRDEALAYTVVIGKANEFDFVEGAENTTEVMASCQLNAALAVLNPTFGEGIATSAEDFLRYLRMVLEDIGSTPVVTTDQADDDDDDELVFDDGDEGA